MTARIAFDDLLTEWIAQYSQIGFQDLLNTATRVLAEKQFELDIN